MASTDEMRPIKQHTLYIITMDVQLVYIYHIDKHKDTYIINYIYPHVYVDIYKYKYICIGSNILRVVYQIYNHRARGP